MPAFQRFVLSALICVPLAACTYVISGAAIERLPEFIQWARWHRDVVEIALLSLGLFLLLIGTKRRFS